MLRAAGIKFDSVRDLSAAARSAAGGGSEGSGVATHLIPADAQPKSRRKPRATSPEEIAAIRAQRAAKKALLEAMGSDRPEGPEGDCACAAPQLSGTGGTSEACVAANYNARQWMRLRGGGRSGDPRP